MGQGRDEMSLLEHITELRTRILVSLVALVIGAGACLYFYDQIFSFFFEPFSVLEEILGQTLFISYIYEGFLIKIKLSLIAGLVISSPVHLFNILAFVFPALTRKERWIIGLCLVVAVVLSFLGFFYGYFYIVPISIRFLTGSGFIPEGVGMLLNFDKNIFYVLRFLMGGVLLFQLPIVLEVLMIMNLISRRALLKASRFVILGAFLISALFTPPDFVSQIAIAVPLIVLYFIALLIAFIFRFGKGAEEDV
ncbi:MAG: twin-arginine translocase subunit TatC [Spirochaetales bacterium]|nr:twin-arginine translocase subunit TatC [Spirochaetales bacterium]